MNKYTVNSVIGEGSFGRVYKSLRKDDKATVAIKVISKRGRSSKDLKNLRRECEIQAQLNHPNIIKMFESFETKNDLVVVTEFAYTDLHRYLARNGVLPEDRAQVLICHLVSALYYLHSNRILHRDLKPQNVLINKELHAKLCDFGLARNMTMGTHVLTSIKGTPLYMAPELLAERPYDHLADLWSLGCISYESMAGQPPFCTTSILHLVKMIKHEEVKWPSTLSSDCKSFLQGLLEKEPSLRATWTQLLCHPFVENKLYLCDNKEITAQHFKTNTKQKSTEKSAKSLKPLDDGLRQLSLEESAADCLTTSRDSINAIPPSDIENVETDFEDAISRFPVPFATNPYMTDQSSSKIERPQLIAAAALATPLVNSQTCYVAENNNMILNHLYDNFAATPATPEININKSTKKPRNKDLEKRKLSQNLENFSLRLGHSVDGEVQRKSISNDKREKDQDTQQTQSQQEQKQASSPILSSGEQQSSDNSPPCLLPGWDSCDESQSPPIENDEWLAFLSRSMQEVIDGELDSLKQHNLVSIIVAPLRNSHAIPKVVQSVAQLLSLPFVIDSHSSVMEVIETVYIEVKLVPNLMYASKLLFSQRNAQDSTTSLGQSQTHRTMRNINEFSSEEILTCSRLFELICYLVHLRHQFLSQFCDAVVILAANDLLLSFLNNDFKNLHALRIANCIVALLCCVLRESPENAELIEKIVFDAKLNLLQLLEQKNELLRLRMCMLIRLLARFSVVKLQNVWCSDIKRAIESIASDKDREVAQEAECVLEELRKFSFY